MSEFGGDKGSQRGAQPLPRLPLRGAEEKLAYPVSPGIEEMVEPELCPVPGVGVEGTGDLRLECDTREGLGRVGQWLVAHTRVWLAKERFCSIDS